MSTDLWIVDAFASGPFTGNPAAVCILEAYPDNALLQNVAMEMNLSETAFLVKRSALEYELRWFTPLSEVPLCGHATLAATHVLAESGLLRAGEKVTYHTLSGALSARLVGDGIELDLPAMPGEAVSPPAALKALGVQILACERNRDNYLVEVKDYATLQACAPDFRALLQADRQGIIVTTATGVKDFDFASRSFVPSCGIDEDPVTGSAHCFLAPYWAVKLGKQWFKAVQSSKRRGVLDVVLKGDRVTMAGQAFTALKGQLQLDINAYREHAA